MEIAGHSTEAMADYYDRVLRPELTTAISRVTDGLPSVPVIRPAPVSERSLGAGRPGDAAGPTSRRRKVTRRPRPAAAGDNRGTGEKPAVSPGLQRVETRSKSRDLLSRGDRIRTCDHMHPMHVRYQTAPHPEFPLGAGVISRNPPGLSIQDTASVESPVVEALPSEDGG